MPEGSTACDRERWNGGKPGEPQPLLAGPLPQGHLFLLPCALASHSQRPSGSLTPRLSVTTVVFVCTHQPEEECQVDSIYENEHLHKWPECQADAGQMPGRQPQRGVSSLQQTQQKAAMTEASITHLWEPDHAAGQRPETWGPWRGARPTPAKLSSSFL